MSVALAVAELPGWCPGSRAAANGSPEETDICVCSQVMLSYLSPVYKDWVVPPGLLSCPRLSVSLTKTFTPPGSFSGLVLRTHTDMHISHIVSEFLDV